VSKDVIRSIPREALPIIEKAGRDIIYDPADPAVKEWLNDNWHFGYNPLAADSAHFSTKMSLHLVGGSTYNYSDPSHAYDHYRKNLGDNYPKYLVHNTQAGWVEYALAKNAGFIGKQDEVWTGAHDPRRWWGGVFPEDFEFTKPEGRFVELMFDATVLKNMGRVATTAGDGDYYLFESRLPLQALVETSKAYVEQVLGFEVK
jgi:hypothetical protein